jgi:hypothetical protein
MVDPPIRMIRILRGENSQRIIAHSGKSASGRRLQNATSFDLKMVAANG